VPVVNSPESGGLRVDAHVSERRAGSSIPLIVVIGIAGLLTAAVALYGDFLVIDTGDGRYSRNVSASMAPAILSGDYITSRVLPHSGGVLDLRGGDLIVHAWPSVPSTQFIERIVGLPG